LTTFILLAALMAAAAIAFVAWPIFRSRRGEGGHAATGTAVVVALAIPLAAFLLYRTWSNFDWNADPQAVQTPGGHEMAAAVKALEEKLAANGQDAQGWMLLGRSYLVMNEFSKAAGAYRKASDLAGGKDPEALLGYAESLAMVDENALGGEAGTIIEAALKLDPQNPKGLWYGGLVALRKDDVATARDRWAALSAQNPPEEIKTILDQRIAEMDQRLGRPVQPPAAMPAAKAAGPMMAAGAGSDSPAAAAGAGAVSIRLKITPALAAQVPAGAPLFVLARDPTNPGPPLAAKRLQGVQFPIDLVLSDADAMAAGRTISAAKTLQIVARFSKSGMPMASSGDLYGEVGYDPARDKGKAVEITIDRTVP
jgi:cytochrome c-type biogenesis protein CcmH